jgi:hypothetical protein
MRIQIREVGGFRKVIWPKKETSSFQWMFSLEEWKLPHEGLRKKRRVPLPTHTAWIIDTVNWKNCQIISSSLSNYRRHKYEISEYVKVFLKGV